MVDKAETATLPPTFDTELPDGSYGCARCGSSKTCVISATELFCYDCQDATTPQEIEERFQRWLKSGRYIRAPKLEDL